MNEYEILLMLDAELEETRGDEVIARLRQRVESDGGTWDGHEPWGRRRLAYEIAHKGEGVYHLLFFTAAPETLAEITRALKITDGVMRHLAVLRVKGGQRTAPPQPPPPPPSAAAQAAAAASASTTPPPTAPPSTAPRPAEPAHGAPAPTGAPAPAAVSATADDAVEAAE